MSDAARDHSSRDAARVETVLAGFLERRGEAPLVSITRAPSQFQSSARLHDIEVRLADGSSLSLVHKELGRRGLVPAASRFRPRDLADASREIRVYELLLSRLDLGTARCYGGHVERQRGIYWLFLERVRHTQLRWTIDPAAWVRTAAWLGNLHRSTDDRDLLDELRLVRYDAPFYRSWMDRARRFARAGDRARRIRLDALSRRYDTVVDALVSMPATVIHAQLFPSNVLVDDATPQGRICVLDWETAAYGPGVIDLAALIAGRWSSEDRDAMVAAYRRALTHAGRTAGTVDRLEDSLLHARLHLAVQQLGWAARWAPPAEQAHDWLQEAMELAEQLSL